MIYYRHELTVVHDTITPGMYSAAGLDFISGRNKGLSLFFGKK
jgi:hypothetical protein